MIDTPSIKLANFANLTDLERLHLMVQGPVEEVTPKARSEFPASLDDMSEAQVLAFVRTQSDNPWLAESIPGEDEQNC